MWTVLKAFGECLVVFDTFLGVFGAVSEAPGTVLKRRASVLGAPGAVLEALGAVLNNFAASWGSLWGIWRSLQTGASFLLRFSTASFSWRKWPAAVATSSGRHISGISRGRPHAHALNDPQSFEASATELSSQQKLLIFITPVAHFRTSTPFNT